MAQVDASDSVAATSGQSETTVTESEQLPPITPLETKISFDILKIIKEAQISHGLKTNDHDVYRKYCGNRVRKIRCETGLNCVDEVNQERQKQLLEEIRRTRDMTKAQKKALKKQRKEKNKRERPPNWNPKYKLPRVKKEIKFTYKKISINDVGRIRDENAQKLAKEKKERELAEKEELEQKENQAKQSNTTATKQKDQAQGSERKKKDQKRLKLVPESRALEIPLFLAERAWSYSRQLYDQYDEDHKRKIHHSNSRLRKAIDWARDLNKLCWNEDICDDFSKLQSAAYLSHLQGTFDLQKERVQKSTEQFVKAKFIYETMIDIFDLKPDSDPMGTLESKSSGGKGKGRNKKKDANEVERQKRGEYYYAQVAEISKKLRYLQMQFDSPQTYAKFVETIETKFGEIVASQIKNVRDKFGVQKKTSNEGKEETGMHVEGDAEEKKDEKPKREFREMRENTLEVNGQIIRVHSRFLHKWIHQFRKQLNTLLLKSFVEVESDDIDTVMIHRRQNHVMRCSETIEKCLKNSQSEMKRFARKNPERSESFSMVYDYCSLHSLRLQIVKNCLWFQNNNYLTGARGKLSNKKKSKHANNKSEETSEEKEKIESLEYSDGKGRRIYHLAELCEQQVKLIDKVLKNESNLVRSVLSSDANVRNEFELLREYFSVSRTYFVSQIYYFNEDLNASFAILEDALSRGGSVTQFGFEYENVEFLKNKEKFVTKYGDYDSCFYLSCLVSFGEMRDSLGKLKNECQRALVVSKAKLALQQISSASDDDDGKSDEKDSECEYFLDRLNVYNPNLSEKEMGNLVCMERKILPLLPKPVLYDLAWNYIEYPEMDPEAAKKKKEEAAAAAKQNTKPHQRPKETHKPKEKQNGWFGGLFGR